MTLFFIAWGNYPGFADALKCARARANCPIRVIHEEKPTGIAGDIVEQLLPFTSWDRAYSIARWVELWVQTRHLKSDEWPVFLADWDMMMCADLPKALAPFMNCDMGVTRDRNGGSSAAYFLPRLATLRAFYDYVTSMLRLQAPFIKETQDMAMWAYLASAFKLNVATLSDTVNGATFDHNIHDDSRRFRLEPDGSKKIVWMDKDPYFKSFSGEVATKANCIHCWGSYKTKTAWLNERMGIV